MKNWNTSYGVPYPLGATWNPEKNGFNFSIYSKSASSVSLLLFQKSDPYKIVHQHNFDIFINKTNAIWHCFIASEQLKNADCYAYKIDGPIGSGNLFNPKKLLLDPWAKAVFFPPDFSREATKDAAENIGKAVLGQLIKLKTSNALSSASLLSHCHDLIIYELHVKGFTQHESSNINDEVRGTFSGIIEKIPYLKSLGITAVELMPVQQFDVKEKNYWGYMTLNFFSVHNKFCVSKDGLKQIDEFKQMVAALHAADIEVILDVIYNHTSEGDYAGPFYSFKGIDNQSYYLLDKNYNYINDAGTGNVLRASYKAVRNLILDSLRYWVQEMQVDGFRFDLASIFTRNDDGFVNLNNPPLLEEISMDPVLSKVRLIAEPWDMASYQLGHKFPGAGWGQWNGEFRDDVKKFVKGDNGMVARLMTRLYGSDDLFPDKLPHSCHPFQSVNFITAHDGFSLYDLVAYNSKHNIANGHNNTDGSDTNYSWNCGMEGDENVPADVMKLRIKQAKNFAAILMLSNGVPMFRMGDEFLATQKGNNNAYNQDNETSWLNWELLKLNEDVFQFFRKMIQFRKDHSSLHRHTFWKQDVTWFGVGKDADLSYTSHTIAYHLKGQDYNCADIYVMINAWWNPLEFSIQVATAGTWIIVADTSIDTSKTDNTGKVVTSLKYQVAERSIVILKKTLS